MTTFKPRERRETVRLSVRLKIASGWYDARVENVSLHGMGLYSEFAPAPGSRIEIRRGDYTLTGRIIWSKNDRFGIHSESEIALADFVKHVASEPLLNDRRITVRHVLDVPFEPSLEAGVEAEPKSPAQSGSFNHLITALAVVGVLSLVFLELIYGVLSGLVADLAIP